MLPSVEPVYGLARALLTPPLRHGLKWTVEGAHLIPVRGPVILASNHVSYLDPLVLAYVAKDRARNVRFLTKSELFGRRALGPVLRATHQIPVQRHTAGAAGWKGGSSSSSLSARGHTGSGRSDPRGVLSRLNFG